MLFRRAKKPTLAISMTPVNSSWGGASPFVSQLAACMWRRGWRVVFDLRRDPDVILVIDPRRDHPAKRFGLRDLEIFRRQHPDVPILHRINECDQRKGTSDIDELLRQTNALCDHTVFISEWLRDYFIERWYGASLPNDVIYNGADTNVYHPIGNHPPPPGGPIRVVTHHWSPHWLKGFDVYRELDERLAAGELPEFRLRVIGRWPQEIRWRAAETFGPMTGRPLAEKLRECHLYITASRWEPCGMHHVEGAQCGLPLVYHEDGGGIVEAGKRYGVGFRDDPAPALREAAGRLPSLRRSIFQQMPSGERMTLDFVDIVTRLAAESGRV